MMASSPPVGKSIVILVHENARPHLQERYSIWFMADYWRQSGFTVTYLYGVKKFVPADICIVHVDLSIVPDKYLEFAKQYPVVVNGNVKDIRKRSFSKSRLTKDSSYSGPVIVKSNFNSAGWPERVATSNIVSLTLLKAIRKSGIPYDGFLKQHDYKIVDNKNDVPENYFDDPNYLVEKFLPERDGELYCVNFYKFFGNVHHFQKLWSEHPVITGGGLVKRENIEPNPEIVEIRRSLGIDYGKLDYCINEGSPVLLDVNKTVGLSLNRRTPEEFALIHQRAQGIDFFFE